MRSFEAYEYVTCPECNKKWQVLDYRCAAHQATCGYNLPNWVESEQEDEDSGG
jgi:hypothetical protein